jgi:hypothetical protein
VGRVEEFSGSMVLIPTQDSLRETPCFFGLFHFDDASEKLPLRQPEHNLLVGVACELV